ncbi:Uncharacterized [Moorella glycerini]|uniref:ECF transporter S component n=1 Tax=Neomoorella stamsii TaxID=1266720 RepID=A0A9X7J610_9FIRM|nr:MULTISPECIES: hypothetical protein [Moorella]PRR76085.1 hypothetical protein MOST_07060 [Moorella stamsii]CEP68309.1 Uncharacterized [Moorella glycerini]
MKNNRMTFVAAMIPAGVALNWVANYVVEALKIPLFLNNMGSIITAIVLGPIWGMVTGLLTNTILALTVRWTYFPFTVVGWVILLLAYMFFRMGWFRKVYLVIIGGAIDGVIASAASAVVATYVFGGFTGNTIDIFTAGLMAAGQKVFSASFLANLGPTVVDKAIQFWLVWIILKYFPNKYLPNAKEIKSLLTARSLEIGEE